MANMARTPDEVEGELAQTRAELDSTLDEIGRRISPREIKERAVEQVKEKASHVGESVQRNPVPLAVAGGLLVAGYLVRRRTVLRREHEREMELRHFWSRIVDAIDGKRSPSALANEGLARVSHLAHGARGAAERVLADALPQARRLGEAAEDNARRALDTVQVRTSQEPLAAIGIAIVVGALLGAIARR